MTRTLTYVEERIHQIFAPAPEFVIRGQKGTFTLREHYQHLEVQLKALQKLLKVVNLGLKIWQRQPYGQVKSQKSKVKNLSL